MAIASQTIPDIINSVDINTLNDMGSKGMFLNMWDYIDKMPETKKAFDTYAELKPNKLSDDKWFALPSKVPHPNILKSAIDFTTMIRGDVLKKHNLEHPKTYDEFYALLKELKKSYPQSYPWVTRIKTDNMIFTLAPSVGLNYYDGSDYTIWDESSNKFVTALDNDNFKFLVDFMRKCYEEKLLDQEYAICDTTQWENKIVSGQGFFSIDYLIRTETMTNAAKAGGNNEYVLESMLPPATTNGQQKVIGKNVPVSYQGISAKAKSPERLMEVYDWWFFSEEGSLVSFFGQEDESFVKNGKEISYKYSDGAKSITDIASKYGTDYYGFVGLVPGFFDYTINFKDDPSIADVTKQTYATYEGQTVPSAPAVVYTGDAMNERKNYVANMKVALLGELDKFIMGKRPMSEWDKFIGEFNAQGYDKYIESKNTMLK